VPGAMQRRATSWQPSSGRRRGRAATQGGTTACVQESESFFLESRHQGVEGRSGCWVKMVGKNLGFFGLIFHFFNHFCII
jgi:hypothetical protein